MRKKALRRTVITIGLIIVFLIAACVIVGYFALGANLDMVSIPDYVISTRIGDRYEFTLDTERIIWEQHLPNPPDSELKNYPEIIAIRSLGIFFEHDGSGYHFETISTSDDPSLSKTLRRAGIVLKNTQWTWTDQDLIGQHAIQPNDGFKDLSLPDYVILSVGSDGSLSASIDQSALLSACGFDLPSDPTLHSGYNAVMSLSIGCTKAENSYRFQAQSTMKTIMEALSENRIRILNTSWTWTDAEIAERTGKAPISNQPDTSGANASPSPTQTPAPRDTANAIQSLYGFDQTYIRVAIRNAKENYYGSRFESGSVYSSYFAVGNSDTPHKNCFRVVYEITTTGGTEYLIADIYDLVDETGYTAADVVLKTVATRSEARSLSDLTYYTVYTLTGGSMVFPENEGISPFDENGFVKEKSISQPLTYDELWDIPQTNELTLLQLLAYARNEMFARAGHQFDPIGSYYRHFSSYDWYEPTGTITMGDLADKWPITSSNTSTIKYLENLIKEG